MPDGFPVQDHAGADDPGLGRDIGFAESGADDPGWTYIPIFPAVGVPRDAAGYLLCSYCARRAVLLLDSAPVYGIDRGPLWRCPSCPAWVGCHPRSDRPLGRLADLELRRAKQAAHRFFDPLWRHAVEVRGWSRKTARGSAYRWLANELGIPAEDCHIGWFDLGHCRRVVAVCRPWADRLRDRGRGCP